MKQDIILRITVAALTRNRPRMLAKLIHSFGEMELPEHCEVQCLIVENDVSENSKSVIETCKPLANNLPLSYVLEKELGIPFARNRASREAIQWNSDLLTFVDDDEYVDNRWLVELVARYRKTGAALIGGPVFIAPPEPELSLLQRAFHSDLTEYYEQRATGAIKAASEGRSSPVTNNWLGEIKLFTEHNLWFDESLRFTGGSDSRFFHSARAMGLKLDWAENAFVYATMSADRLNFGVQLREAHSRTINRIRLEQVSKKFYFLRLPLGIILKLISATFLAISLPLTGGRGILKLTRRLGLITGRISAAFGGNSSLYTRIFGN